MDYFSKSEWSGFEATTIAWGGIAAGDGNLWLGGALLLIAFALYTVRVWNK